MQETLITKNFSEISSIDTKDHIASISLVKNLSPAVDLKPHVFEVENQLHYGSCTANAGCSALELMYNLNKTPVDLSRFYLYYYTRQLGDIRGDNGAYPRDIGKALKTYGTCFEETWKYTAENLDTEPNDIAKEEARRFKILSYETIVGTPDEKLLQIKTALSQNIPVLLSITCHDGFFGLSGNWKSHTWDWNTTSSNPSKGGHELLIIGYDDVSQRFLVENSWGSGWGDGGFCGIPYEMINSLSWGELWILTPNFSSQVQEESTIEKLSLFYYENKKNILIGVSVMLVIMSLLLSQYTIL